MARAGLDWPRRARAESTSRRVIKPSGLEATSDLKSRPTSRACDFAAGVARTRTGSFATATGELTGEPAPGLSALGSGGNLSASGPAVAASPAGAFSQASSGRSVKIGGQCSRHFTLSDQYRPQVSALVRLQLLRDLIGFPFEHPL